MVVQNYCKLTYNSFAHKNDFILPTFIVQNYGKLTYISFAQNKVL